MATFVSGASPVDMAGGLSFDSAFFSSGSLISASSSRIVVRDVGSSTIHTYSGSFVTDPILGLVSASFAGLKVTTPTGGLISNLTGISVTMAQYQSFFDSAHRDYGGFEAFVLNGDDSIAGSAGGDTLAGFDGNDSIVGGAGADVLQGGNGDDILNGGAGSDAMSGGAGDDTYIVDSIGDIVMEDADEGTDTVLSAASFILGPDVENLTLTGAGNFTGTGNALDNLLVGNAAANALTGNAGNDTLNGGAGADALIGRAGDDTYVVDNAGDAITELAGQGSDTVQASLSYSLEGKELEHLTLIGAGAINATGNEQANTLTGNSAANRLDGAGGADIMQGGAGNDTYLVDDPDDAVIEGTAAGGIDRVESSATFVLGEHVENLTLLGGADLEGTGNALANTLIGNSGDNVLLGDEDNDVLTGNAGDDRLDGQAGNDRMSGGAGDDIYAVDAAGDVVTEALGAGSDTVRAGVSYALGANLEKLELLGTDDLNGTGNALANEITGNSGDNVLRGGLGADALNGGEGSDTASYAGSAAGVTVDLQAGTGVGGEAQGDTLSAIENLIGSGLKDTLRGDGGANVLNGGAGADALIGRAGDDTYVVDNAGDAITELAGQGSDTVQASLSYSLEGKELEHLTLIGAGAINATGNEQANTLTGNSGNNVLRGGLGADALDGGDGIDTASYANSAVGVSVDLLAGTGLGGEAQGDTLAAIENLIGSALNDSLSGDAGSNVLTGNAGDDRLDGQAGNDRMSGGAGDDIYAVDAAGDVVTEALGAGSDTVHARISYALGANLEKLELLGTDDLNGTGNALANEITGNSGDNVLRGGLGADALNGGEGSDTASYAGSAAGVTVDLQAGTGVGGEAQGDTLSAIENLIGSGLKDTLRGDGGANVLNGGAGADALIGRAGDDTYVVDNAGDAITELAGQGSDTVQASLSYSLEGKELEHLTLIGAGAINATGNEQANTLTGNSGNNVLRGGLGADALDGGDGIDTASYANSAVGVSVDLLAGTGLGGEAQGDTLAAIENLIGSALNDSLSGDAGSNVLTGNAGDDRLDGQAGNDRMSGGAGDDIYAVDAAGDVVTEALGAGSDTVRAGVSYALGANLEKLELLGTDDLNGTGNALANEITGNSGDNVLRGGLGADALNGGEGSDTASYAGSAAGVTVDLQAGTGVGGEAQGDTLSAIENLIGSGLKDTLRGDGGANVLNGGAGADALIGRAGDDTYVVDNAGDAITELAGQGSDTVQASLSYSLEGKELEHLTLIGAGAINATGNEQANTLTGNSGNNVLRGGLGADALDGGDGIDTASYANSAVGVSVDLLAGTGLGGEAQGDTLAAIENLIGSALNDSLSGDAGSNVLTGNAGDDRLDGQAGNDRMSGGAGDDIYAVDAAGDVVTEALGAGSDTVRAGVSYALGANLEKLELLGTDDLNGTGNALANEITGNSGDNVLRGGLGADALNGGEGSDTASYAGSAAGVTVDLQAGTGVGGEAQGDTLSAIENLIGSGLKDTLRGDGGANVLNGGAGADALIGRAGDDTYVVDNAGDAITELAGQGSDTVQASLSYSLEGKELEHLTLIGAGAINATGNEQANTLTGNSAANRLDGAGGADIMQGGAGNDTYLVDASNDAVIEGAAGGIDRVESSASFVLGEQVENLTLLGGADLEGTGNALANTLIGNSGDNVLLGDEGNDVLTGNAGDDTLDGQAGNDRMSGGAGDDIYAVDAAGDVVTEALGAGSDTVRAGVSYALGANLEKLELLGTDDLNGTGNALANEITGNSGDNVLRGGLGADALNGGEGSDTASYAGSAAGVTVDLQAGTGVGGEAQGDTLSAIENLIGSGLKDTLRGDGGANVLNGGAGADALIGRAGDDTYVVDNAGDVITELAGQGSDTVQASLSYSLKDQAELEHLTLTGAGAINATGNDKANTLIGNSAANRLDGAGGADLMQGGAGNDTYLVDDPGDTIIENPGEGTDTVLGSFTLTLGANVENLTLNGSDDIDGMGNELDNLLVGNAGDNTLSGGAGNDQLDGGAGADTMSADSGDDTYVVDDAADLVTEALDAGFDTVRSSIGYTLGANLESLILIGAGNVTGAGNELDNRLFGNSGVNLLDGGAGADIMSGGGGNDTYIVDNVGDSVSEMLAGTAGGVDLVLSAVSFTLGPRLERLTLTGTDSIDGTGNALSNLIVGNVGNNTLDGRAGADSMIGGLGDDIYIVDNVDDRVTERAGEGSDTVQSAIDYTLGTGLENLTLTGTRPSKGTGNALDNVLTGNAAANVLDGRAGADSMRGRAGDDVYLVDNAGDSIAESSDEGNDTVRSSVSFVLAPNIENLTLTGAGNLSGTGNGLDNIVVGNAGANTLTGGAGDDSIDGGTGADAMSGNAGDDTYVVDNAGDTVSEGLNAGFDTVKSSIAYTLGGNLESLILTGTGNVNGTGNTLRNTLTGNTGNNVLNGGAGDDTLTGGAGDDSLNGGAGADRFHFGTAPGAANLETIVDFLHGQDLLVLNPDVFGSVGSVGNQLDPSQFRSGLGVTAAIDANDHVMYDSSTGALYYDADGTGTSSVSVQFAVLTGTPAIDSLDFLVARI